MDKNSRLNEILNPDYAALLAIDLQNDFLSPKGLNAKLRDISPMTAVLPKVEEVTSLFYGIKRPVIRTKIYEDLSFRNEAGKDRYIWFEGSEAKAVACQKGSWGSELYIPAEEGDIVIEKTRSSAYINTPLRDIIRVQNIKTIFIAGVKTQRCVMRTAQDLYENEPNLHVVILEDCVASDNVVLHKAILDELKHFYPPVLASNTLLEAWKDK